MRQICILTKSSCQEKTRTITIASCHHIHSNVHMRCALPDITNNHKRITSSRQSSTEAHPAPFPRQATRFRSTAASCKLLPSQKGSPTSLPAIGPSPRTALAYFICNLARCLLAHGPILLAIGWGDVRSAEPAARETDRVVGA